MRMKSLANYKGTTLYLWGRNGYDLSTIPATVKIINGKKR